MDALSPDDVVSYVLEQNLQVESSRESQRASEASVRLARLQYETTWNAGASARRNVAASLFPTGLVVNTQQSTNLGLGLGQALPWGGQVSFDTDLDYTQARVGDGDPSNQWNPQLSLSWTQPLWKGAGLSVGRLNLTKAERELDVDEATLAENTSGAVRDALKAWGELAHATRQREVAAQAVADRQARIAELEARISVGAAAPVDLLAEKTQLYSETETLATADQEIRRQRLVLGRLIGRDGEPVEIILPSDRTVPGVWGVPVFDDIGAAIAASPQVASSRARVASAEASARVASNAQRPDVSLSASASARGFGSTPGEGFESLAAFDGWGGSVGITVSAPVSARKASAAQAQADAELRAAQAELRRIEAQVRTDARTAVAAYEAAQSRVELARQTLEASVAQREAALAREQSGSARPIEVREAQADVLAAERRVLRAEVDVWAARLDLLHLEGGLI